MTVCDDATEGPSRPHEEAKNINNNDQGRSRSRNSDRSDTASVISDDTTIIENCISTTSGGSGRKFAFVAGRSGTVSAEAYANLWKRFEDAQVAQNRLELQNEQLLKQWEEALEYSARVQIQLREEIARKSLVQEENVILVKRRNETIVVPRSLAVNAALFLFVSYFLWLVIG